MKKKTIIICKGGSVFYTRDLVIERGEQGETEGIINHLLQRDDVNLVFYGQYRGYEIPGLTVVQSTIKGLDNYSLKKEQIGAFKKDEEQLAAHDPIALINVSGQAPTSSLGWNPMGAQILNFAVRYSAPMLMAMGELNLPRICLNNDPRSYPRDQEMRWYSDYCRPVALLDQCEQTIPKVVSGESYRVKSVYGACQSWAFQHEAENEPLRPAVIVAHAHFKTGIKMADPARWYELLDHMPPGTEIYGEGWEHYDGPNKDKLNIKGKLKPGLVFEQFRTSVCGPVVPHTKGFITGKPYVMMSQGCIPIFHPEYDQDNRILPADHWCRMKSCSEFGKKAHDLWMDKEFREQIKADLREQLKPDWEVFDKLIDTVVRDPQGFMADKYWNDFGGYKRM